jgi:hypothetical protein
MTGIALLAEIQGASVSTTAPTGLTWTNIFGFGAGQTNICTVAGLTGAISISLAITGGATLFVVHNGVQKAYTGAFKVLNGDTLGFVVQNPNVTGGGAMSGAITVTNATASTTIQTINYIAKAGGT